MKEVTVQFTSGRRVIANNVIDYMESEDFDVIITSEEEHITLFRNQIEYMIVKDLKEPLLGLEEPLLATTDIDIMKHYNPKE